MLKLKKKEDGFSTPYTCMNAIKKGGIETKLSMVLMGFGNFVHKQKIKGLLYLAVEAAYWYLCCKRHWIFKYAGFPGKCSPERSLG